MNMPAKVCLGAGAFLVMSGGLLAITGFAMGAQTHLDLDWGRAHKSETPVDTGAPHVEEGTALPAFSRLDVDVSIGDVTVEYGGEYGISLTGWGWNMCGQKRRSRHVAFTYLSISTRSAIYKVHRCREHPPPSLHLFDGHATAELQSPH